jgi:hypothetical protein
VQFSRIRCGADDAQILSPWVDDRPSLSRCGNAVKDDVGAGMVTGARGSVGATSIT